MAMAIILNQQCMMAFGNIVKEDEDLGTVESQQSPLLRLAISYRMPVYLRLVSSSEKSRTSITLQGKYFSSNFHFSFDMLRVIG